MNETVSRRGPMPRTTCFICGQPLGQGKRRGAKHLACYQAEDNAKKRAATALRRAQGLNLNAHRGGYVTNTSTRDRVLRCASCGEFVRFDVDGFGRCMESCKCSTRWAVATGAA